MRKKLLIIMAVLALAAISVSVAFAATDTGDQYGATAGPRYGLGTRLCENLGLTSDQLEQIQALRDQVRSDTEDLWAQAQQLRAEIRDLRRSGADQAEIDARVEELRQAYDAIRQEVAGQVDAAKEVLTPEQEQKLLDHAVSGLLMGPGHGHGRGMGRDFGSGFGGRGQGCPMFDIPQQSDDGASDPGA
jgi:Spy/CpxP family protein refolding chaperone